jgi:hypothetical protein
MPIAQRRTTGSRTDHNPSWSTRRTLVTRATLSMVHQARWTDPVQPERRLRDATSA